MSFTTSLGYTPAYRITKGGSDVTGQFEDRAINIQIESYSGDGASDRLTIVLDDRDFTINSPITDGSEQATLALFFGYKETALYEQGTFTINEATYLGPPSSMQLVGSSIGFGNAVKAPLITSYDGKTVGDIVSAIATAAGVKSAVEGTTGANIIKYMHQHSSSMHLLQELERRYNGVAKFQDGMLSFTPRGTATTASGGTLTPFTLSPEDFGSWSIRETARHSYSQVKASYWDPVQHKIMWLTNTNTAAGNSTVPDLIKRSFNTMEEAQAAANARMDASNRSISTGNLTLAKGDPSIRGGTPFTITGMREGIDGDWIVECATHSFNKTQGIVTMLKFYSDGAAGTDEPEATPSNQNPTNDGNTPTPLGQGGIGHQ